jgi:CelD/BcsL family acetyltransferase involved in cellulose biosynthesis
MLERLDRDGFRAIGDEWRALSATTLGANPFVTFGWLDNWLGAFGGEAHRIVALRDQRRLVCGWVAREQERTLTALEDHTYWSDVVTRDDAAFASLLAALAGEGVRRVALHGPRGESRRSALASAVGRRYVLVEKNPWPMHRIELPPRFESYLEGRDAKVRSELRRKRRRFESRLCGAGLEEARRGEHARALGWLEVIERDSWKFEEGTSIASSATEERFYRGVLELPSDAGEPRTFALVRHGEPIAFLLGFVHARTYFALKTSYRGAFAEVSPGLVLLSYALERLIESGEVDRIELLGRDSRWKRELATSSVEHCVYELHARDVSSRIYSMAHTHVRPLWARLSQGRSKP